MNTPILLLVTTILSFICPATNALPPAGSTAVPSAPPNATFVAQLTPVVEIWRAGSDNPQIPRRHGEWLELGYIQGSSPTPYNQTPSNLASIRLLFDPQASGKSVEITGTDGLIVNPGRLTNHPDPMVADIDATGACIVAVALDETYESGVLVFHCEGVVTKLKLSQASPSFIAAREIP